MPIGTARNSEHPNKKAAVVAAFWEKLGLSNSSPFHKKIPTGSLAAFTVLKEQSLITLGYEKRPGAPSDHDDKFADIYLQDINDLSNEFFLDISVAEICFDKPSHVAHPESAMTDRYNEKLNSWLSYFDLGPRLVPLVFDNWGNWHGTSDKFLKSVAHSLACGNDLFAGELISYFRDAVAVSIAESQFRILRALVGKHRRSRSHMV